MSCEDILKQRCADDSHDGIYWITLRRSEKLYNHGKISCFRHTPQMCSPFAEDHSIDRTITMWDSLQCYHQYSKALSAFFVKV